MAANITVIAAFEGVKVSMPATVPPGDTVLHLLPGQFPQLHLDHPRLWWPNGYGSPELYHLKLQLVQHDGLVSDTREVRFGVREVTYELSLFDHDGHVQRVETVPVQAFGKGYDAVDVHHAEIRQTVDGWAYTISRQAEGTAAIRPISNEHKLNELVLKVNGVPIAVRGGNWGMDDARKRVSRERLEPYFRLHREANLNMVRNWVGQSTEETFYQLADEYGMMVWNDFWASTEDTDAEPEDLSLFIDNARDVVKRYRNHPSIVVWCGRNEGVPQPALNDRLISMLHQEDGTRLYFPSSNVIDLHPSGPYRWRDPSLYFSKLNRGFSVELGISSFPTQRAFESMIAPEDRWPLSDAWAYHDWHQREGGDTHELMQKLDQQLGASNSLPEFERRIQLFNYVDHRAIFEGMYAHLWTPNSGRMIWMTQPAWPSTMWQLYSSDYDTQASFYGVKKANAPLHVQMDLSDYTVTVVNTTLQRKQDLRITAKVVSASNATLDSETAVVAAEANAASPVLHLPITTLTQTNPLVFVRLEMRDATNAVIADNFYWVGRDDASYRQMNILAPASLDASAIAAPTVSTISGDEQTWNVHLKSNGTSPSIAMKLTLLRGDNTRVLPAYYSDNYISLLPGEERIVVVHAPRAAIPASGVHFALSGWNLSERNLPTATTVSTPEATYNSSK